MNLCVMFKVWIFCELEFFFLVCLGGVVFWISWSELGRVYVFFFTF